ncbi:V-type ATP synthase subunit I domain-containing protein [Thermococcus sibiricus]|nr:hypothetical protein [Thermococcus sibiricus]
MNSEILDFRTLLTIIYEHFGTGEFTARELSDRLREAISNPALIANPAFLKVYRRVSKKMISNDLRRLYAMGFLKRRRVKRKVMTKSGKVCHRGYEYRYSLSSQGLKYLAYMASGGHEREEQEGFEDFLVKIFIEKKAPEEIRDILWEFYETQMKDRKGFRRFSTSQMAFWDKVLERITEIFRDKRIKSLEERVKALEEENKELREKIRKLEMEKTAYKTLNEKLLLMLTEIMELTDRALEKAEHFKEENERYREIVKRVNKVFAELGPITGK